MSVIAIEFTTVDGVVADPDGSAGTEFGGWAYRHGPESLAGDKFRLGATLDDGVLLLGRNTWLLFAGLWPGRTDDYARRMNAVPKLVASRTRTDTSAWANSTVTGDAVGAVRAERRDVIITGSLTVVRALMAEDLIDEYRLLVFPALAGSGARLFPADAAPAHLELREAEQTGPLVYTRYTRA